MLAEALQVSCRNQGSCRTQLEYHGTKWFPKLFFIRHKSLLLSLLAKNLHMYTTILFFTLRLIPWASC